MKVLFVHPPHGRFDRFQIPSITFSIARIPPLGGITLAAYLRKYGHSVKIIDGPRIALQSGNVRAQTYEELIRQAQIFAPELVAVTMLTSDVLEAAVTVKSLKRAIPKAIIVAGGPHPSGEPEATLRQIPELDGIGIGPGEEICLALANGKPVSEVEGCAYLESGRFVMNPKGKILMDIDSIPFPSWDLIDGNFYSELNNSTTFGVLSRSLGVMTARGCPGNCYFCSSKWNRPIRSHSVEYVLDLCAFLADTYPIDTINFFDDTLATREERLADICEGFIRRGLHKRLKWRMMLRADQAKADLLRLMKRANCFYAGFGSESGSDRVLKLLNKGVTVRENIIAAEAINQAGLLFGTSIILGSPGETEADMMETLEYCKRIKSVSIGVGNFCPLPGSPAYSDFVKTGKIDPQNADWWALGNFSYFGGKCFANMDAQRYRKLYERIVGYCVANNRQASIECDQVLYPEIVALLHPKRRLAKTFALAKTFTRTVVPDRIRHAVCRVFGD